MLKRARLIYNPSSGREAVKQVLPEILDVYEKAGYETSAYQTTPEPLSAQKEAERCCDEGFDLVIAAGGDGTVHEVINGISGKEQRPTLAIIPAGTTNDYARALHIPRNSLVDAAKLIEKEQSIYMDIGQVTTEDTSKYFMNIGALGNLVEVTFEVSPQLKTRLGYLAYVVKGAELLPQIRPVPVHVEYEGGVYDGEASLIFIALSNSVGGFEKIVPDKVFGDGQFSLIIVKTASVLELMHLARKLFTDENHLDSPHVINVKTDFVNIETTDDSRLMVNLDGEYGGDAPVQFKNIKHHIEVIANKAPMNLEINDLSAEEREKMQSIFTKEMTSLEEVMLKKIEANQEPIVIEPESVPEDDDIDKIEVE